MGQNEAILEENGVKTGQIHHKPNY